MSSTTNHGLGCRNNLQAFQEFQALGEFRLKDQDVKRGDQNHKIAFFLGAKGIEAWKFLTWENPNNKEDQVLYYFLAFLI